MKMRLSLRGHIHQTLGIAAAVAMATGISSAQISFSLSHDFKDETLNIGKGMNGDVTLSLQTVEGQPQAVGGVTVREGNKVSFDSSGNPIKAAGYWKGLNSKPYRIVLRSAQESVAPTAAPLGGGNQTWLAYNSKGATVVTRGANGAEIMPFILQRVALEDEVRGAWGVLEVSGIVRWDMNRNLTDGKDSLLRVITNDRRSLAITETEIRDGTLFVSTADGSKYKLYAISYNFTATIEEVPNTTNIMSAGSSASTVPDAKSSQLTASSPIDDAAKQGDLAKARALLRNNPALVVSNLPERLDTLALGSLQWSQGHR